MPSAEPSLGVHPLACLHVLSATPASKAAPGTFCSLFSYSEQLSIAQVNVLGWCWGRDAPKTHSRWDILVLCTLTFTNTPNMQVARRPCPGEALRPLHTHTRPRQGLPYGLSVSETTQPVLGTGQEGLPHFWKVKSYGQLTAGGRQYC